MTKKNFEREKMKKGEFASHGKVFFTADSH